MSETTEVLIVGAGLSGIGAACHLERDRPGASYTILEARDAIGGTWDLFRYPGIRSDSDMFTLGYDFKPWLAEKSIADGHTIRDYIRETAREYDVERHIRFGHKVLSADWSSETARWTVTAQRESGEQVEITARFIFWCSGYYRYDQGFTPEFPGIEDYRGTVIHPQHWPEDFDAAGKRVVVIGSGATAVTLVPSLAKDAAHVTMLQRSPTYIVSLPAADPVANFLRRRLPTKAAYAATRWLNVGRTLGSYQLSRRRPELMKRVLRRMLEKQLPDGYDIDTHFKPSYDPWDQRLCLVPDGDLFKALRQGTASVVTDRIRTFTADGIELESGKMVEADVVVTATGLNLELFGGAKNSVDGEPVDVGSRVAFKGTMLSGVPNAALAVGYTNASWTLKCDLIANFVTRLLQYMDEHGYDSVTAREPDPSQERMPMLDLKSGYITRALDRLPQQTTELPYRLHQNYFRDISMFRKAPIDDPALRFGVARHSPAPEEPALAAV
jgi:cation diffusion facilitator CzcD-associated flavoprotein CzcO